MLAILTVAFGLLGLLQLASGVQSFRARRLVDGHVPFDEREPIRRAAMRSAGLAGLTSLSFFAAATLVHWYWPLALLVGGWPIVAFLALFATGNVTVISRLSSDLTE
jgi:hypothetical protein